MARDVRQTVVTSLELEGLPLVVDAEEVLHRGVQVVHVDRVLDDVVAELVGLTVDMAAFDAAAGHPEAEATRVVVAAVRVLGDLALAVSRAAEFAAPDHERVFQQAALLEVLDEGRRSLVGLFALALDAAGQTAVLVPALVEELDEADALLDESARLQAVGGEGSRRLHAVPIHREGGGRLLRKIGDLRHARLHAIGHLGLRQTGVDFRVEFRGALVGIELAERIEHATAGVRRDAFGIRQEEHRFLAGLELHALVFGRQEARAPEARVERLVFRGVLRDQHDEGRQVLVHAAKSVGSPGAHRRTTRDLIARAEERDGRVVVDGLRVHRTDHAEIVGDPTGVTHQVAVFDAALSILLEIRERARQRQRGLVTAHAGQTLALTHRVRQRLRVFFAEQRLGIEGFEMRRSAGLEEVDDAFGLGREVRALRQGRRVGVADDAAEREGAEAEGGRAEEVPTRGLHQAVIGGKFGGHGQREVTAASLARMVEQTRVRAASAGSAGIFGIAGAGGGAACFFVLASVFFGSALVTTGAGANCGGLAFCVA